MRRVVLTLGGTAAGLVALLSLKMHPAASMSAAPLGQGAPAAARPGTTPSPARHGTPAPAASPGPRASAAAARGQASAARAGATAAAAPARRVITGQVISTPYGPMQVQVTLTGSRITAIAVLQQTDMGSYSQQLDSSAIPQLTQEALTAQSANISAVSGASYTSSGYAQSLQSALDQARA